ncbi:unnamed protein product [Calypogeia fissa]
MASPTAEAPVEVTPTTSPSARSSLSKRASTGGSPLPPPEQSSAGAAAETAPGPSPQPRQSIAAAVPGSPPAAAGLAKEAVEEPAKKTAPTQGWDYSQPLPNHFFRPALTDLCFPVLAKNFAKFSGFGNLPANERLQVVNEICLSNLLQI